MSDLIQGIDERMRLAAASKLEILLFTLGADPCSDRTETFGINVCKVREVMHAPPIARAPDTEPAVAGMVSLRGALVPVIDLARYAGLPCSARGGIMIVTEYSGRAQGFLVESVDTILRLDWARLKAPPDLLARAARGSITAVAEHDDGRLIMMMDVEKVLADAAGGAPSETFQDNLKPLGLRDRTVLFADDSAVARRQIASILQRLDVRHVAALNGRQAWQALERIAAHAGTSGKPVAQYLQVVLTDVEMPEMDGYMLTRKIKTDPRFRGVRVLMHSSLCGDSSRTLGRSAGADEYVSKFEPQRLAAALGRMLA